MERVSGIRRFSDRELETLRIIDCLKKSGLEIREIRKFMNGAPRAVRPIRKGENFLKIRKKP